MAEVITASAHGDWRIYACGDFGFVVMYWRPDRDYALDPPHWPRSAASEGKHATEG